MSRTLLTVIKVLVAVAAAVVLYLLATKVVRGFLAPAPASEPDPASLRPVHYRYRCTVCGAEVTMTAAPGDDEPEPPRHCREDMVLVADVDNN